MAQQQEPHRPSSRLLLLHQPHLVLYRPPLGVRLVQLVLYRPLPGVLLVQLVQLVRLVLYRPPPGVQLVQLVLYPFLPGVLLVYLVLYRPLPGVQRPSINTQHPKNSFSSTMRMRRLWSCPSWQGAHLLLSLCQL
jgi:hypothetical protein